MKVYRVHFRDEEDMSLGFEFFSSKEAAERRQREHAKQETAGGSAEVPWSECEAIEFKPTRQGILKLLEHVAHHPDNG